ncbi:hypothetical protein GCM10027018_33330 [Paenibacillus thermoaerophilus]
MGVAETRLSASNAGGRKGMAGSGGIGLRPNVDLSDKPRRLPMARVRAILAAKSGNMLSFIYCV